MQGVIHRKYGEMPHGLKIERGGGGKAIFSELRIADFPETLDPAPLSVTKEKKTSS